MSKRFKYLQVSALVITSLIYLGIKNYPFVKNVPEALQTGGYHVARVVDGDTLELSTGEKVRLIGVDTPEARYNDKLSRDSKKSGKDSRAIIALGIKASKFTKDLCLNKKVRLDYDVEKHDRYDRILAYVYLEDGTFINARIIEEGYGRIMTIPPNVRYAGHFRKLEREARLGKKGLWKSP